MKRKATILCFIFCLMVPSLSAQERIEATQWYMGAGEYDAFEVEVYDQNNSRVYYSAHHDVIDSYGPLVPDLSTYTNEKPVYLYKAEAEETKTKDEIVKDVIRVYEDGVLLYHSVNLVIGPDTIRTTQYEEDSQSPIALYESQFTEDGAIVRTWYDPLTSEVLGTRIYGDHIADCFFIYKYDSSGRIIREILLEDGFRVREKCIIYWEE